MNREQQKREMRERILQSALKEFNEKSYETASLNRICSSGGISKGIIYHYFKDKETLYLECVKRCYEVLSQYYMEQGITPQTEIPEYLRQRMNFFIENPDLRGVFFRTLIDVPPHLKKQVTELGKSVELLNRQIYINYLGKLQLRDHISLEKASAYLEVLQNVYNEHFRRKLEEGTDLAELIEEHEKMIPQWLNYMLFGIAEER